MTIVVTMTKLLFAMAVGFYLNKKNILDVETSKKLSAMVVNLTSPLLIISSAGSVAGGSQGDILLMLVAGLCLYASFPLLSFLMARMVHAPSGCRGVYQCMLMFANTAFMGYPVVQALYGETAIFYTTIFNFGYTILFYTYASYLLDKEGGKSSRFNPKRLINIGLLSGLIALIIPFSGIMLPGIIMEPCSFIGSVTTPLSMLIVGSNMANYPLHDIFSEKRIYVVTAVRLLAMPLLTALYMSMITDNALLICMAAMTIGMPVGSMVAMASSQYEKQARIGSISVVMSTICSMVTIPVLAVIFNLWFGV
ncbi:MAG: AEC family transporter [Hungatella sp.]|nr:AEC family transporter [Hungatella sp.]